MKKRFAFLLLPLAVFAVTLTAEVVAPANEAMVAPPLVTLAGFLHVAYGKPKVRLTWTDTITGTVIRTDVMRRDSTDTVWRRVGYTTAKYAQFEDDRPVLNRAYHYRVRDSVSGSAMSAYSDSIVVRITAR